MTDRRPRRWVSWVARGLLLVLGLTAVAWLVAEAGTEEVAGAVRGAWVWVAVALLLEGGRIACEAASTVFLLGERAQLLRRSSLVRMHLIAYAISMAMPAGRAASEALKAVMLTPVVGAGRGAAVGTASQGLNLVANATVSVPAAVTAWIVTGPGGLTLALAIHAAVSVTGGMLVLVAARSGPLSQLLERIPRLDETVRQFRDAAREQPLMPPLAAAAIVAGRSLQVVQFGVLAHGVGLGSGPVTAMLAHGVQAVGATAGDLVPGQVGVTEGAFRIAAEAFGASAAVAVSVALLAHAVQLVWIIVGALVPVLWRARQ